ncbi:facilitated trehalose transporter Tret1-like isoform X2 [Nymphalis io]|uniref:facilitated trehalose transporter Tret1-like isoform X2 n=1 Tax=Inachis io TaxID=171585 RepID=UPI002168D40D|nr:facilitated trehalose transporter Tret1-like isoform X2 [Nymphalis io]
MFPTEDAEYLVPLLQRPRPMKRIFNVFREGSQVNQILCAFLICIPIYGYGNCIGWMSPMTLLLQSEKSPKGFPLTDNEISWMASLPYLICVPGTYLVAWLGDKYGRKNTLLFMSAINAIIWILKLCSMNIWVFIVARILVGIVMAGSCVTCPTYIKEISEDKIRGALGCWEATKALVWLRCRKMNDVVIQEEMNRIKREQKNDEGKGKFLMKNILTDKILFRAFQISLVAALARELCGAVPVLNFAGDIFLLASDVTGVALSPNQQAIVLGVVQLCGATMASGIVERCGRRPLLFITCIVSGISMCILATWFLLDEFNISGPAWIPVLTLCMCIFCDAAGLMPISVVIAGETFSFKYRGTVLATTMAIASMADFFQLLFFKPLSKSIGIYAAFYFFGAMCLITALYVILIVPETKNRKLEEIYYDLRTKKEKRELTKQANGTTY